MWIWIAEDINQFLWYFNQAMHFSRGPIKKESDTDELNIQNVPVQKEFNYLIVAWSIRPTRKEIYDLFPLVVRSQTRSYPSYPLLWK